MTNLIAIAVIAGLAVALQGQFMGTSDRVIGTLPTVFVTYGGGAVIAAILLGLSGATLRNAKQMPWYAWTSGALGLIIVAGIGYAAPRLGLSRTLVITVAAQLCAAALIDHFGLFTTTVRAIDPARASGIALTIAGVWLVVRS